MIQDGLGEIADQYDHFIIDIFGVIHDGRKPFPGTLEVLTKLKDLGKQTCLLSNTPRPASGAIEHMEEMEIPRDLYDHIVTSGEATHYALKTRPDAFHQECGNKCWFIGTEKTGEVLDGLDLEILDGPEGASFILNSIPGTQESDIALLKQQLQDATKQDLPMICANPDMVVNVGGTQYECAGTYAKFYEDHGGRVVYHGKPHQPIYERCYELLGRPDKSKILAIGDAFHTDIHGANDFGVDSVLNLVGIHWEEVALDHAPEEADLKKLETLITNHPHKPTYVTSQFAW